MLRPLKILLGVVLVGIIVAVSVLWIWFEIEKAEPADRPVHFDLFIAEKLHPDDNSSPFDIVGKKNRRPLKWMLSKEQYEKLDTVLLSLTNDSGEKFYYTSWGSPFSRFRQDLIMYRSGVADSLRFGGHGCGTGVYVAPLESGATIQRTIFNPLMFNPYSNYDLPLDSDSFPSLFKEIYGDSVAITLSQATYSLPWNKYPSQMIYSDRIVISTQTVLDNWYRGDYISLPNDEPTMEEHFGLKKFGQ